MEDGSFTYSPQRERSIHSTLSETRMTLSGKAHYLNPHWEVLPVVPHPGNSGSRDAYDSLFAGYLFLQRFYH